MTSAGQVAASSVRNSVVWPVLVGVGLLAGAVAAGIGALSLADALTATGLPDPGPVTTYGLPFVRAAGEIAAVIAVGSFLFSAFLAAPQTNGVLDVAGYRALRLGSAASGVWTVCAALLVPLTVSDVSGQPLLDHLAPVDVWSAAGLVDVAVAWRWTAILAAAVTIASLPVLRWGWTPVLLAGSLLTLMPLVLTGHSSAGGAHDLATNSLFIHLVAAALWAGGLLALLAHAIRAAAGSGGDGPATALAARRFSALALWCFIAMAVSGVLNALVRIQPSDLVRTSYGWLLVAKLVALSLLGVLGWRQRRASLTALAADAGARRPLIRLALTEAALFGATFGIAVGLGRTPPPPEPRIPSATEVAIGYDFAGPPTVARVLFDWRFDLLFGTAAIVGALVYLAGVYRLRRRGDAWPVGRTFAWLLGCAVLLFTTSSGLGRYMPAMFSVHMIAHMLLSMLVPVLLVLGAPVTLALRALPTAGRGSPPGPREWLLAALHSRVSQFLTHPIVATVLFVAGFYGLYFGGIFDAAVSNHAAHILMNVHFLLSGYLFYWVVIGVDPTPRPVPHLVKIGMVFASLPLHAFFGVVLMGMKNVLGESFYRSLQLPWHTDLLGDQHLGGAIAWAAGEVPLVIVMLALLIQWRRSDQRTAKRLDRAADRDDDADLAAYNAMLAEMARRDRPSG
ncbi:bifunctional copper resistance protein CopD/cytochrome c oxidase assembly protein [Mycolicibacterium septicum DSM 44393]|uniref:Bifunctional copper resistance protein CopD/cytochrome c oxidase assembly protein n=1 Tax=Mycolicibacterium septicum DSM 44393 TaxID=1341646 RepID=A0A7X6MRU8_9MYCO|nr:cytochrome c oxidase assembly protein [Mycolicibacterium septicum]NKZ13700.1 bifunctional copper resistance protein CopD/cytochrome c oxidase assembly protein [Mycolicibacterium septicum DSM 44393]